MTGQSVGWLTGSYDGMTKGVSLGAEEGKKDGLSAVDTEVEISNKIKNLKKLEVLSAQTIVHDVLKEGNGKYAALYVFYGDITFTVDLLNVEIKNIGNNRYNIELPDPESTPLILNDAKTKQLDYYIKHQWSGSNEDGYLSAINSIDKITVKTEESIQNYDELNQLAKNSAKNQIEFLIKSLIDEEVVVNVTFKGEK